MRHEKIRRPGKILLLLAAGFMGLAFASERQKVQWKGRIEKGDGFIIVKNPKNPMYPEGVCSLKEEMSIPGIHETKNENIFSNIKEIDADENGNIFVLDAKSKEIKVFDKDGVFIQSIGSLGQGPGEFQWPWSLFVSPKKQLAVADLMRRSLFFFSLDGKFDRMINTPSYDPCDKFAINSKNEIIAEFPIKGARAGRVLKKFNSGFEEAETIAKKEKERIPLIDELTSKIVWRLDKEDKIVWGDSAKYEINIRDGRGKLIQRIMREFDLLRINESEHRDEIKRKFGGRPIPTDFEQELPKFYPAFRSIGVDGTGRIFVGTFEKNNRGDRSYDVFDPQGRYLTKIYLASLYQVWKNDRLYAVETDQEEGPMIKIYKVNWKN